MLGLAPSALAQVIVLPPSPADLGSVPLGSTLNGSFTISNATGEPDLNITGVSTQPTGGDDQKCPLPAHRYVAGGELIVTGNGAGYGFRPDIAQEIEQVRRDEEHCQAAGQGQAPAVTAATGQPNQAGKG